MKVHPKFGMYVRRTISPTGLPALSPRHIRRSSAIPSKPPQQFRLQNFRLMRTIGTGTFARVRLARHKGTDQVMVLKIMKKSLILQKRQTEHVTNERRILGELSNPFIVKPISSFQDSKSLYLVMEYIPGGELYTQLRLKGKFTLDASRFYAAEVASVFAYLHDRMIMYRDLKPENVLINRDGHLKLVDFGFVKKLKGGEKAYTMCGTPEYLPPEIIGQNGHGLEVDWWTLGIFIYEMAVGRPPFEDKNPMNIYTKILERDVEFPAHSDESFRGIVEGLLQKDPAVRFVAQEVVAHAFFAGLNWRAVEELRLTPPFLPVLKGNDDTSYFDKYKEESDHENLSPVRNFEMFPGF